MNYESPKQIRARQLRAENRRPRRKSGRRPVKLMTDAEWADKCEFHVSAITNPLTPDNAGAHAQALVHVAVARRAHQLMNELDLQDYWKAKDIAKNELLNCKIG
jgi:hypothetical protein